MTNEIISVEYKEFLEDLKTKVAQARFQAVRNVNQELILLYYQIGADILKQQQKLGWGAKVIDRLSKDLSTSFPDMKGFGPRNLKYMRLFSEIFQDFEFVQQAAAQLPWFHIVNIMEKVKNHEERVFYIHKAIENGWSRAVLVHQIEGNLYNRQGKAITNFKNKLPSLQSDLAQEMLKSPYNLGFLGLTDQAREREIENGLMQHMQKFLVELGAGFAFMGRQYHLEVGGEDFYIDMLFYNVKLRSYFICEIKSGKFKPEYAGKMSFYLAAVDDLLKHPTDNPSIGLILCKSKNEVVAEYALRDINKGIGLSEYKLTEFLPKNIKSSLPSIEELEEELKKEEFNEDSLLKKEENDNED